MARLGGTWFMGTWSLSVFALTFVAFKADYFSCPWAGEIIEPVLPMRLFSIIRDTKYPLRFDALVFKC